MNLYKVSTSTIGIALVIIYAVGSGFWVSSANSWYQALNSPVWQPPDWVFGIIWPYNFIVLGSAAVLVGQRLNHTRTLAWLTFLALSVLSALMWAYLFYQPHRLVGAAICLVLATLLTFPVVILAFNVSRIVGIALIPYQIWLTMATSLSVGYAILN
jgi:benzodiazapine receptor